MSRTHRTVRMPDAAGNLTPQQRREDDARWNTTRDERLGKARKRERTVTADRRAERHTARRESAPSFPLAAA